MQSARIRDLTGLLQSLPFFAGVPKASLVRIAGELRRRHVPKGTVVFREGDAALEFCLLSAGRLEVDIRSDDPDSPPVGTIEAPGWFGELAILTRKPRTATVVALTDSEVWTLSRGRFEAVFSRNPQMGRNLVCTLCERIQHKDWDFLNQSTLAVERARLLKELRERNEELAAMGEVTRAVNASLDLDEILERISTYAAQLTHSDSASLFLYDEAQDALHVSASYNTPDAYLQETESRRSSAAEGPGGGRATGDSLLTRVIRERAPVQIPEVNVAADYPNRDLLCRWGYKAILGVPIVHEERVIGAMCVRRKRTGEFIPREVDLVTTFARQSVVAIEKARLFREIRDKARELEVVSRHKSQFLANMSHELRTPLNAIIGFSEILLDQSGESLAQGERQEFLANIFTSGKHLLRLINDILDLSKIEAGKMELHLEAVSLAETVEGVLATVKSLAAKKHLRIESGLARDHPSVWADPSRLKQVLYNLVSNAIKFTPNGGRISVTAREIAGNGAPLLYPSAQQQCLEVSVIDSGIGIPATELSRIFGEFEQVTSPSGLGQEGTGLGLALVKKLVEMHGGTIRVASTPGEGSTFMFTIPVAGH